LNRDLSKVIIMDSNPDSYSLQPENAIALKPWMGDPNDTELVAMIPFLESMSFALRLEIALACEYYNLWWRNGSSH